MTVTAFCKQFLWPLVAMALDPRFNRIASVLGRYPRLFPDATAVRLQPVLALPL